MLRKNRPITPGLGVYKIIGFNRDSIGSTTSFLNRPTGFALYALPLLFILWSFALLKGPDAYQFFIQIVHHPISLAILFLVSLAFFFHLLNGFRYVLISTGMFLNKESFINSARFVVLATLVLTAAAWYFILV